MGAVDCLTFFISLDFSYVFNLLSYPFTLSYGPIILWSYFISIFFNDLLSVLVFLLNISSHPALCIATCCFTRYRFLVDWTHACD